MAAKVLKVKYGYRHFIGQDITDQCARLWDDGESKWKKNVQDIDGEVLCGIVHSLTIKVHIPYSNLIHP